MIEGCGEPTGEPVDWPWDDLTPDDFPAGDEPGGIAILDAEHVAELRRGSERRQHGRLGRDTRRRASSQFAIRPLLPDEAAAAEL